MKTAKGMTTQLLGEFHGIKADIVGHRVWGVPANALMLDFAETRNVLSSREGFRKTSVVCNCYVPESIWRFFDTRPDNWKAYLKEVLNGVDLSPGEALALSTGINMEDLAWREEVFDEFWVLAFVTAGVKSNAMRVGKDGASDIERDGQFEKVGTINIILLTNVSLNSAAMAASFITITEAKVIALQELNIRSSYNHDWQATGTGTDQIIVVSGREGKCTYVGGHSKIGELMAKAVTSATICAVKKDLGVAD